MSEIKNLTSDLLKKENYLRPIALMGIVFLSLLFIFAIGMTIKELLNLDLMMWQYYVLIIILLISASGFTTYLLTVRFYRRNSDNPNILIPKKAVEDYLSMITELEHNQNRFKSLVEKASDLTVIFQVDGKFDYVSPSVRIGGYSPEDFINKYQPDFFHADDMSLIKSTMEDSFNNPGEPINMPEVRFRNKGGSWIWLEGELTSLQDTPGINGIVFNGRDVSDKKTTEKIQMAIYDISEATNQSADLYHLFNSIHFIIEELMPANNFFICLYDEVTQMLEFPYYVDEFDDNPGAIEVGRGLTGYVIRTGESQIIDEKLDKELREAGEVDLVGELCKIWVGIPLRGKDKIIGVMVVQDYKDPNAYGEREKEILTFVSEQIANAIEHKKAEDNIRNYLKELQLVRTTMEENAHKLLEVNIKMEESEQKLIKLNANKDKFFSIISHDLKGPFTGLLGITEMLVEDYDDFSDEERKELILGLHKSTKSGYELLEGLLEWSRVQRGAIEFQPQAINLSIICDSVVELTRPNAVRKNIELVSDIEINETAFGDENMVNTVIRNLVANAIKFTNSGGMVKISSKKEENFVKVCISDNGIGMNEEDRKKLFRIEIHHTTVGTNKEKGTGVGLILCKELVEKNNGKIWVESELNKGSTFCFILPDMKKSL